LCLVWLEEIEEVFSHGSDIDLEKLSYYGTGVFIACEKYWLI